MMAEVGAGNLRLHVCLRADDGILMLDAARARRRSRRSPMATASGALRERHGLPEPPTIDDYPSMSHMQGAPSCTPRARHPSARRVTRPRRQDA